MADARAPRPLDIDAVLFDLDGTLADTAPDLAAALNGSAPRTGWLRCRSPNCARGRRTARAGSSAPEWALPPTPPNIRGCATRFSTTTRARFASIRRSSARSATCWLKSRRAECAGASSPTRRRASRCRCSKHWGSSARAHAVVCGDTTPHAKPHPAPLLAAAQQLRTPAARCVYVGDAERDVTAGIAAGMRTIDRALRLYHRGRDAGRMAGRRQHRLAACTARLASAPRLTPAIAARECRLSPGTPRH